MTLDGDSCKMESRIVKLETRQEALQETIDGYGDALRENTKSINNLCQVMIRHDEMLQNNEKNSATRNAIFTGIAVGIVVFLINNLMHLI